MSPMIMAKAASTQRKQENLKTFTSTNLSPVHDGKYVHQKLLNLSVLTSKNGWIFSLVPCEKHPGKILIGQVLTTEPIRYGLCAGLGQVAPTWPLTPLKYIDAFPRGNGIILSQTATPIDTCFNCIVLYCQDTCKSNVVSSRAVSENVTQTLPGC